MESQGKMLVALSVLALLTGFSAIGYVAVQKNANVASRAQVSPNASDSVVTTSTSSSPSSTANDSGAVSQIGKTCTSNSQGDFDCNGAVDCADVSLFVSELSGKTSTISTDVSADGKVSLIDFERARAAAPAGAWSACTL